jgi:hypothetical protein
VLGKPTECSPETAVFYNDHPHYFIKWLKVSSAANVSNSTGDKDGGKGVFAIRDIPSGTRICPYVGVHRNKPCPASVGCQYDLHMHKDVYLCGREQLYMIRDT